CTIQKEVGERLSAEPRTPAYGPASVTCQILAEIELIAILPPTAFWPRPKVQSLMLTLRPRPSEHVAIEDVRDFISFVQRGFSQRRKKLRRLVRDWDLLDALAAFRRVGISPDARPEEVAPDGWRELHRAVRAPFPPK
ncbi:MAG: rRNA adenine N-6-methyltransferase family protein, partial [bacterium]